MEFCDGTKGAFGIYQIFYCGRYIMVCTQQAMEKKQVNKDWWREPKFLDTIPVFYFPVLLLSYLIYSENWIFQSGVDFCLVMTIDWLV